MLNLAEVAMILIVVSLAIAGLFMIVTGNIPPCGC
jgi:hypothetical protein